MTCPSFILLAGPVPGSIRERSLGVRQVRVSLGRDPDTRKYTYAAATVRGGRREAQRVAAKLATDAAEGKVPVTAGTLAQLLDRWLEHIESQGRAPKTLAENRRLAARIADRLGTTPLRRLRGADIDAFYDALRRSGLAPASVRRYHAVLSAALHQAVRWGLLDHSPVTQATPPSVPMAEPDCPTPEQVRTLIEVADQRDPSLARFVFVAASTGCRRGELCGLRFSDVDFNGRQLTIRRSVSDLPGQVEVRATKIGRIRRLAMDDATAAVLDAQREEAASACQQLGTNFNPDGYVWSQVANHAEPWRPSRATAAFVRLRTDAGLPRLRLHHLRHFAASIGAGVDVRTAAGRLGRAQPNLTLRTYAHVMEASDRRAADIVASSLTRRP